MAEHSPEPWKLESGDPRVDELGRMVDANGMTVFSFGGGDCWSQQAGMEPGDVDIRRIVACVNFCRKMSTEFLESHETVDAEGHQFRLLDAPTQTTACVLATRKRNPVASAE